MKIALLVRRVALVGLAVLAAWMPMPVQARQVVSQAGPFAIPVSKRTVERLSATLKLDADQKATASALYSGYRAAFKQAAEEGDKQIQAGEEKFRESGSQDYAPMMKDRIRVARAFADKVRTLERSFLDDIKAILTPEQAALFERAERARRRDVGFQLAFIAGEASDVIQILLDLKIDRDSKPELREELDTYEVEVDRALVAKEKMLREVFEKLEQFEGSETDPTLIEKTLEGFFTSGNKIRDLHRQCARKVTPHLPPDKVDAFDRAFKKAGFPRVYKESGADKVLAAAQGMADLSADQKTELASIAESYRREADGANARWAAAIEDKQAKMSGKFMEMMGEMGEEKPDDPLKLAREARKALDERTIVRINQLLTPDQKVRMPEVKDDDEWHGREFMPDFDEQDVWEEWKKEDEG